MVARGLAYAHARGVIHRDVKPANIMTGDDGEVVLIDWGIAKVLGRPELSPGEDGALTLGYAAPEQVARQEEQPSVDCWALGACLYQVLTGRCPPPSLAAQPQRTATLLEREGGLGRPGCAPLEALCRACLSLEGRPTATEVAAVLQAWLDGSTRRVQAERSLAVAAAELGCYHDLRRVAERQARRAEQAAARLGATAPLEDKRRVWAIERRAEAAALAARQHRAVAERRAHTAVELDPDNKAARAFLVAHFLAEIARAETRDDRVAVSHLAERLQLLDPAQHAAWAARVSRLDLVTTPAGARVTAWRLVEHDRRLVPTDPVELGPTPLVGAPLPLGRSLVEVSAAGHLPVRIAVEGRRDERVRPGEGGRLRLPRDTELGPDDLLCPEVRPSSVTVTRWATPSPSSACGSPASSRAGTR